MLTDKITDLMGGLFSKMDMSEVLTEILHVDPTIDRTAYCSSVRTSSPMSWRP